MKLRRDISSVPLRTGAETWSTIVELITGSDSIDPSQLTAAASVMATLIAEELHAENPLTLVGTSHRLVIYCSFGADALIQGEDVDALGWNPTAGDWTLHVPCGEDDLGWAGTTLANRAPRIKLHQAGEPPAVIEEAGSTAGSLSVDWGALS